jgi:peptide/nickel transport system ATP-binding protein
VSLLEVSGLVVEYAGQQGRVRAVDGVDLAVEERTTVGLVGESGSGKTSFARALVGLIPAREGRIAVEGVDVTGSSARKHLRRSVQLIFQDPYGSLNPRMTIDEILGEAITTHHRVSGQQRRARITELLDQVGLPAAARLSYPFQFAVRPRLLVADEVTSSLDVSVQAAILNLLVELQRELGIAYLVISHDLSVIRYLCDAVNVMHLARIVESAPTDALFERPQHPYTSALLASVPQVGGEHGRFEPLEGEVPDPLHPPSGCRFRTRCPVGPIYRPERAVCIERDPHEDAAGHAHAAACHFAGAVTTNHVEQEVAL